jgi:hypothetical protein
MSEQHTLSVLVENKPGVLVRIAGLFSSGDLPDDDRGELRGASA